MTWNIHTFFVYNTWNDLMILWPKLFLFSLFRWRWKFPRRKQLCCIQFFFLSFLVVNSNTKFAFNGRFVCRWCDVHAFRLWCIFLARIWYRKRHRFLVFSLFVFFFLSLIRCNAAHVAEVFVTTYTTIFFLLFFSFFFYSTCPLKPSFPLLSWLCVGFYNMTCTQCIENAHNHKSEVETKANKQ